MIELRTLEIGVQLLLVASLVSGTNNNEKLFVDVNGKPSSPFNVFDAVATKLAECPPCDPSHCHVSSDIGHPIDSTNFSSDYVFHEKNDSTLGQDHRCDNNGVQILDDCGCCAICVRKPNETCGGLARRLGACASGSVCWPAVPPKGEFLTGSEAGVCMELSHANCGALIESKGCNLYSKQGCVCANVSACRAFDFQYAEEFECHNDWKRLQEMWHHDCLNAKCNVVFQPHCPSDSVFVAAPPPEPPDCCPTAGSCECAPTECPNYNTLKQCPHGSDLILTRKATGEPGFCCDIYECLLAPDDECSGVVCPRSSEALADQFSTSEAENVNQGDCPHDSFRPLTIRGKDRCCPVRDECRCRPGICQPANCAIGLRVMVRKKGTGSPGSCCDKLECVGDEDLLERHLTTCEYEGEHYRDGATWRPSVCTECTCKDGVNLCRRMECASSTCTRLVVPEDECCPICVGCTSEDGEVHNMTDEWQKDDCTACSCDLNGQILCQKQLCKVECDHPIKIPGECCPKCDKPLIIMLPQICPNIELCPLRCEYGLKRNDHGCFLCECNTDVFSDERDYYEKTSANEPANSQSSLKRNCSAFDGSTCKKNCAHGYEHGEFGCPECKCKLCPAMNQCYKHCLNGFQKNAYGCAVCKCKGSNLDVSLPTVVNGHESNDFTRQTADLSACHLQTGEVRDHGEWWFDGCRHCYCDNGREYCSLLACPPLNCTDPVYESDDCCPRCPGSSQDGLVQRLVCHAPGSGRLYVEGEYWNLEPCISCTCHIGHILCYKEPCPPVPCDNPITSSGQCCPVCKDLHVPKSSAPENGTFCQASSIQAAYADGTVWKSSPCESCVCQNAVIDCYKQHCPLIGCTGRLLQVKYDCCPVCTGHLENGACKFSNSLVYSVGEKWRDGPCRNCSCVGDGETLCTEVECPRCVNTTPVTGQCCPQCNDGDDSTHGDLDLATWSPGQSSTRRPALPELPRSDSASPHTSVILLSCLASALVVFVAIILLVYWYRKRSHLHSHQSKGAFAFVRRDGPNGEARLTNFPGYDQSKSKPAIIDLPNNHDEQTKTLLNPMETSEDTRKGNHLQPDIVLSGKECNSHHRLDDKPGKVVKNGTLLCDYDLDGWDVEKV